MLRFAANKTPTIPFLTKIHPVTPDNAIFPF